MNETMKKTVQLLTHLTLLILSVILYLRGFFPIITVDKSSDNNNQTQLIPPQTINHNNRTIKLHRNTKLHNKYQHTILIVIDALRLDFIAPHYMPFLYEKLNHPNNCFYKVHVASPTVTLPRIKALTTGNVPQFTDIIGNVLTAQNTLHDSLLHRAAIKSLKKIVFYGDDTWLRLFPERVFHRSEGTSSFYVNDFDEVDRNVTRNVDEELERLDDWDFMILHYLGLDHIGHVLGPKSPPVQPKLKEMDEVIRRIYHQTVQLNDGLILVTGDHGMKDSGGHGGASYHETNVPFIVLGIPDCLTDNTTIISQTDLAVNLAVLMGLEIPSTSIGRLYRNCFFNHFDLVDYLYALRYNTLLLLAKKPGLCPDFDLATHNHVLFLVENDMLLLSGKEAVRIYENCSRVISSHLLESAVEQNVTALILAIVLVLYLLLSFCNNNYSWINFLENLLILTSLMAVVSLGFIPLYSITGWSFYLIVSALISLIIRNLVWCWWFLINQFNIRQQSLVVVSLFVIILLHPFTMFSSSLVEEEHQYWYFSIITFLLLLVLLNLHHQITNNISIIAILLLIAGVIRFVRTLNQTGDKWSSEPDLSDWLLNGDNYSYLLSFFFVNLLLIYYCLSLYSHNYIQLIFNACILGLIGIFRYINQVQLILGRIIWLLILFEVTVTSSVSGSNGNVLVTTWILISTLLLKPYNIILIPVCILISRYSSLIVFTLLRLQRNATIVIITTLFHLVLGNTLFFAQGHSNSLASVDVSSGYIGLSTYRPFPVILQILSHTYALPVLSHILLLIQIRAINDRRINNNYFVKLCLRTLLLHRMYTIFIIFIVMLVQRYHLFIWTVFAPKLFIESSHCGVLFIELILYYCFDFVRIMFK